MQRNTATLSPEDFVRDIEQALPNCSPKEGARLVEHANAWATDRYDGEIPEPLLNRLKRLEAQCRTLTMHAAG